MKLILPAPRNTRWYEMQIAGMVGQEIQLNGHIFVCVFAIPVDGTPEEGASAMELEIKPGDSPPRVP